MTGLAPDFDLLRSRWPLLCASDEPVASNLNVTAAWDGGLIAQVAVAGERHVQDALFAAFSMFRQKDRWLTKQRRIELLEKAAELVDAHAETLALESARESGKPIVDARREVQRGLLSCATAVAALRSTAKAAFPDKLALDESDPCETPSTLFQHAEPGGVVVAVLAANGGLELAARYLFAALAAGCPIIIKPSTDAPLSCLRLVHLLHEAGLPYVWSQCVVPQSEEVTRELVCDPRVAQLCFVGAAALGWSWRAQLPPGTRCTLDHGGVTPAIVADDADMTLAADALLAGAFCCAGQDSLSIQRAYLSVANAEAFARELGEKATALPWGDPMLEATRIGPLIREAEVERIHRWVTDAVAAGAHLIAGGYAHNNRCYAATVLLDPPIDALVSTQPCFGPVLCVYSCTDLAAACERANALPYALVAAVFTRSRENLEVLFKALDGSAISLNQNPAEFTGRISLQGLRRSGLGGQGVLASIDAMQISKTLLLA